MICVGVVEVGGRKRRVVPVLRASIRGSGEAGAGLVVEAVFGGVGMLGGVDVGAGDVGVGSCSVDAHMGVWGGVGRGAVEMGAGSVDVRGGSVHVR